MCGLITIYDAHQPVTLPNVKAIQNSLNHRGPDGFNYFYSPYLFMGHSKLQIESAEKDQQPIRSEDGSVTVVVNGELYPYPQLKRELENKGCCFQTESDSELALVLYQQYGENFVNFLRGEFACILWDENKATLLAVRDRFGIKPLHYAEYRGRWLLGSEAKAIIAAGFPAKWSYQGLRQCFSHQYLVGDASLFGGIKQLPPGHMLKIQHGKYSLKRYDTINYGINEDRSPLLADAIEDVKALFENAVQVRIPSREKCAFSLSGGLDSSAVVCEASKHLGYPPDCYTVSFEHNSYDEFPLVANFAKDTAINLHKVNVTSDLMVECVDDAAYCSEGLACNGQYMAKYLLNRAISNDGYRVVMSGEGADEAFMGYAHLHYDFLCHDNRSASQSKDADGIISILEQNKLQQGLMLGVNAQSKSAYDGFYVPSFLQAKFNFCRELLPLFTPDFLVQDNQRKQQKELLKLLDLTLSKTYQSNKLWTELVLANYILKTLGDGMEMASSVEGRLPFLDHSLFHYAAQLPIHYKLSAVESKKVLRQAVKGMVPDTIQKRRKHPFIAPPLSLTLSQQGFNAMMDKFTSNSFKTNPVFNQRVVIQWLENWRRLPAENGAKLDPVVMMLLSFAALQNHFKMTSIT